MYFFLVPTSPPADININPLSATSFNLSWNDVPKDKQHATITGYIIFYRKKLQSSAPYNTYATPNNSVVLIGLDPGTEYIFRLLAYTSSGNGVASELLTKFTLESCKLKWFL